MEREREHPMDVRFEHLAGLRSHGLSMRGHFVSVFDLSERLGRTRCPAPR